MLHPAMNVGQNVAKPGTFASIFGEGQTQVFKILADILTKNVGKAQVHYLPAATAIRRFNTCQWQRPTCPIGS